MAGRKGLASDQVDCAKMRSSRSSSASESAHRTNLNVAVVALAIMGAFPNVDREVMLSEMERSGFESEFIQWESSFLIDRASNILGDGFLCEHRAAELGLPAGSPGSPNDL